MDDLAVCKTFDSKQKQYLLVSCLAQNTNASSNKSNNIGNFLLTSTEVCYKWNLKKYCLANYRFVH